MHFWHYIGMPVCVCMCLSILYLFVCVFLHVYLFAFVYGGQGLAWNLIPQELSTLLVNKFVCLERESFNRE